MAMDIEHSKSATNDLTRKIESELKKRTDNLQERERARQSILENLKKNQWEEASRQAREAGMSMFGDPSLSLRALECWQKMLTKWSDELLEHEKRAAKSKKEIERHLKVIEKEEKNAQKTLGKQQAAVALIEGDLALRSLDLGGLEKHITTFREIDQNINMTGPEKKWFERLEADLNMLKPLQNSKKGWEKIEQINKKLQQSELLTAPLRETLNNLFKKKPDSRLLALWLHQDFLARMPSRAHEREIAMLNGILGEVEKIQSKSFDKRRDSLREIGLWQMLHRLEWCIYYISPEVFILSYSDKGLIYAKRWTDALTSVINKLKEAERKLRGKKNLTPNRDVEWNMYLESRMSFIMSYVREDEH